VVHHNQSSMPLHGMKCCVCVWLINVYMKINLLKAHVNTERSVRITASNSESIVFGRKKDCTCLCMSIYSIYLFPSVKSRSD
jgi:hypothetical protein